MKVLYMSGYSSHAAMASGAFQGRDGFIQKPFSPHDLADKVRRILDRT